ncbi:MAG: flagellar hook assembly protein FlgD [Thermodesulfobacteriota bacterium]
MSTYNPSHIIGKAETDFYSAKTTGKSELDKEDFLLLLVTQLQHQDPLNPMDDKEFTAQLANFSSLEQLTNINNGIKSLTDQAGTQDMRTAVSYIGRDVRASGDMVSVADGKASTVYYFLDATAESAYVNLYDVNGNIVRTAQLGSQQAGEHTFAWDGKDWAGKQAPDGLYYVYLAAQDADGQAILTNTEVSGRVSAVQSYNGSNYLRLADGRIVNFNKVYEVVDPSAAESSTTGDE